MKAILSVIAAIILIGIVKFAFFGNGEISMKGKNNFYKDLLSDKIENLDKWIAEEGNVCLGFDAEQAQKAIADLKNAGAQGPYFCDIIKMGECNVATFICWKMPADKAGREKVRTLINSWASHKYEEYIEKDDLDGFEYYGFTKDL